MASLIIFTKFHKLLTRLSSDNLNPRYVSDLDVMKAQPHTQNNFTDAMYGSRGFWLLGVDAMLFPRFGL